jgi:hypothetical protein
VEGQKIAPFYGNRAVKFFHAEAVTKEVIIGQITHLSENCIQVEWTKFALLIYPDDFQIFYYIQPVIYGKVANGMKVLVNFLMASMEDFICKSLVTFLCFLCSCREVENLEKTRVNGSQSRLK